MLLVQPRVVGLCFLENRRGCETKLSPQQLITLLGNVTKLTDGRTFESENPVITYWDEQRPLSYMKATHATLIPRC